MEDFTRELRLFKMVQNLGYDQYLNPVFGSEDDADKPNIFIRLWRKFVQIVKKIFNAIVNFFKAIIDKIVYFVKWVVNKLFGKKKSKEDIQKQSELFDKYKDTNIFKLPKETENKSEEALENKGTGNERWKDEGAIPKYLLHDLSICRFDSNTFQRLEKLTGYTKAFVISASNLMRRELKMKENMLVGENAFEDLFKQSISIEEKDMVSLFHLERNYVNSLQTLTDIEIINKKAQKTVYGITKKYPEFSFVTKDATLICKSIICNKKGFKSINDLEAKNFNIQEKKLEDLCSKEFFIKMYKLDDDMKKVFIDEVQVMENYCKDLQRLSKEYYKFIDEKSTEFTNGMNDLYKKYVTNDPQTANRNLKIRQAYFKDIKEQFECCRSILTTIFKISNYSFNFRANMIRFVNTLSSKFSKYKRDNSGPIATGQIKTLYGPLTLTAPNANHNFPPALKGELETIWENYMKFKGAKRKDYSLKLVIEPMRGVGGAYDPYIENGKIFYKIELNEDTHEYFRYFERFALDQKGVPLVPVELLIAVLFIHEVAHSYQKTPATKNKASHLKSELVRSSSNSPLKQNFADLDKISTDLLTNDDLYGTYDYEHLDKNNPTAVRHHGATFYTGHINEQNADREALTFIKHIVKQLPNCTKDEKENILKNFKTELLRYDNVSDE
jgi:hypothetical protein